MIEGATELLKFALEESIMSYNPSEPVVADRFLKRIIVAEENFITSVQQT